MSITELKGTESQNEFLFFLGVSIKSVKTCKQHGQGAVWCSQVRVRQVSVFPIFSPSRLSLAVIFVTVVFILATSIPYLGYDLLKLLSNSLLCPGWKEIPGW